MTMYADVTPLKARQTIPAPFRGGKVLKNASEKVRSERCANIYLVEFSFEESLECFTNLIFFVTCSKFYRKCRVFKKPQGVVFSEEEVER